MHTDEEVNLHRAQLCPKLRQYDYGGIGHIFLDLVLETHDASNATTSVGLKPASSKRSRIFVTESVDYQLGL